uniref:pentatricopeptide repeat-containing protein At3g29230-like n=1 Tax=Erigeron canadensis TaxID=72917 RepID=UPI001CB92363|nr:pentatricopeptide repeat-containing protein At3g29230-like [Erigeron canadensis]
MISKPISPKFSSLKPQFDYLITNSKTLKQFKQIHAQIIISQLPYFSSKLASFYALSPHGNLSYAKTIFNQLPKPSLQLYNALIRAFSTSQNQAQESIFLFLEMLQNGVLPNNMTFPFVFKACMVSCRTKVGILVHTHVLKCGFLCDLFVQSSLIKFYANGKCLSDAKRLFDECCVRDVVCWNSMIDGYVKCGEMELARKVFDEMPTKDVVSWNSMINGYGIIGRLSEAKEIFERMPVRNVISWNSMLAGYVKCGNVEDVVNMFRDMPCRDVVSWNAMLACYAQNGKPNETLALFDEMRVAGVRANEMTVVSVLSAVGQLGVLDQGLSLHLYIIEKGIKINSIVATALIDMYVKCGNIPEALKVFGLMKVKDILTWNTMLMGLGMHGHVRDAQNLFKQMQGEGVLPNDMTFVAMFGAFRHAGMTEEGQKLLSSMLCVYGVEPKVEHYGCVIDLLSRAGRLEEALEIIRNMPMEPNAYAWGALLGGCKIHGNAKVAQIVGKHLLDLEPHSSGRYVVLSNIYAGAKRWDDARSTRKLMQDNGVAKTPGLSVIELKEDMHGSVVGNQS